MKKTFKNEIGITLIALIITIIVMLILVAVTIQVVISSGLLSSASKAAKDYQAAAEKEATMNKVNINNKEYNSIEEYVGTKPQEPEKPQLPEGIKVGDYVNYTPETGIYKVGSDATGYTGADVPDPQVLTTQTGDKALKWRILSIDELTGKVELVAETQTEDKMYFEGATGYNHCVDILNDMCKDLYSNSEIGAEARSIKIEDIQAKTTYDFNSYTHPEGYKYGTTKYQMTAQYVASAKYPNLYKRELGSTSAGLQETDPNLIKGSEGLNNRKIEGDISKYTDEKIDANGGYATADSTLWATWRYVNFAPESYLKTDAGLNNPVGGIFKTDSPYWVATRYCASLSHSASFDCHYFKADGMLDGTRLFTTHPYVGSSGFMVRPVVSLPSSIQLTVDAANTTETVTTWNI